MTVRHVDWYADEWLAGTRFLGPNEGWLYTQICNLIYSHRGPIRHSRKDLAKLCNMHGNALNASFDLLKRSGKIIENDGEISVTRCGNELEKANKRVTSAQENGGKGGRPPNKNNDIAKPAGFQDEKLTTNLPTTNHQPPKESRSSPPRGGRVVDLEFEIWWKEVPLKVGKPTAQRKYTAARKLADAETLLSAIRRYAEARAGEDRKYTAHPATWLHNERWLDDLAEAEPMRSRPTGPPPRPEDIWPDFKAMGAAH